MKDKAQRVRTCYYYLQIIAFFHPRPCTKLDILKRLEMNIEKWRHLEDFFFFLLRVNRVTLA